MEQSKLNNVLNDIQNHFHFLFEGGFTIYQTEFRSGATWIVILRSDAFIVRITSDRLELSLTVVDKEDKYPFELFEIVYFVSNKQDFIGVYEDQGEHKDAANYRVEQLQRLAAILHKYLGDITAFFTGDPKQNYERLQSVRIEARALHSKVLNEKLSRMNLP